MRSCIAACAGLLLRTVGGPDPATHFAALVDQPSTALYGDSDVQYAYGPSYGDYTQADRKPMAWTPSSSAQHEGGAAGDRTRYGIQLESGSLLVMWKHCQKKYLHSVPKDKSIKEGRLNLTFRYVASQAAQ